VWNLRIYRTQGVINVYSRCPERSVIHAQCEI
jgi:hypothetical protein